MFILWYFVKYGHKLMIVEKGRWRQAVSLFRQEGKGNG
jgi:hypothetical protein